MIKPSLLYLQRNLPACAETRTAHALGFGMDLSSRINNRQRSLQSEACWATRLSRTEPGALPDLQHTSCLGLGPRLHLLMADVHQSPILMPCLLQRPIQIHSRLSVQFSPEHVSQLTLKNHTSCGLPVFRTVFSRLSDGALPAP